MPINQQLPLRRGPGERRSRGDPARPLWRCWSQPRDGDGDKDAPAAQPEQDTPQTQGPAQALPRCRAKQGRAGGLRPQEPTGDPRALPLSPFCPVNPMVVIHRGKLRPPARPSTRPRGRGGSRAVAVPPPGPHRSPCFLRCPQEQAQQKGGCRQRAKAVSCPARLRGHIC